MFTPSHANMPLIFIEFPPRPKAFALVAGQNLVQESVCGFLCDQHLLVVERVEQVVEVGVDEAEEHA